MRISGKSVEAFFLPRQIHGQQWLSQMGHLAKHLPTGIVRAFTNLFYNTDCHFEVKIDNTIRSIYRSFLGMIHPTNGDLLEEIKSTVPFKSEGPLYYSSGDSYTDSAIKYQHLTLDYLNNGCWVNREVTARLLVPLSATVVTVTAVARIVWGSVAAVASVATLGFVTSLNQTAHESLGNLEVIILQIHSLREAILDPALFGLYGEIDLSPKVQSFCDFLSPRAEHLSTLINTIYVTVINTPLILASVLSNLMLRGQGGGQRVGDQESINAQGIFDLALRTIYQSCLGLFNPTAAKALSSFEEGLNVEFFKDDIFCKMFDPWIGFLVRHQHLTIRSLTEGNSWVGKHVIARILVPLSTSTIATVAVARIAFGSVAAVASIVTGGYFSQLNQAAYASLGNIGILINQMINTIKGLYDPEIYELYKINGVLRPSAVANLRPFILFASPRVKAIAKLIEGIYSVVVSAPLVLTEMLCEVTTSVGTRRAAQEYSKGFSSVYRELLGFVSPSAVEKLKEPSQKILFSVQKKQKSWIRSLNKGNGFNRQISARIVAPLTASVVVVVAVVRLIFGVAAGALSVGTFGYFPKLNQMAYDKLSTVTEIFSQAQLAVEGFFLPTIFSQQ